MRPESTSATVGKSEQLTRGGSSVTLGNFDATSRLFLSECIATITKPEIRARCSIKAVISATRWVPFMVQKACASRLGPAVRTPARQHQTIATDRERLV